MQPRAKPLICLVGPTASGKTAAALALADQMEIELVSVDSALVYRSMDIGTAKPDAGERARVAHHLIDLIDPMESYSAAQFCSDAKRAIADIRARNRTPVLVGGTMLYLKALREGLDALPIADVVIRAQIDAEAKQLGWPALHRELRLVDPSTARRLAPTDSQRIQRALEVYRISGIPLSDHFGKVRPDEDGPERFVHIALEPSDRLILHARIEERFDRMLERGFVDEVRGLRIRGDLHLGLPSMRCVGYRQIWEYLDGTITGLEMRGHSIAATRQLAKRQLTWLRAIADREIVDCLAEDATEQVVRIALSRLGDGN